MRSILRAGAALIGAGMASAGMALAGDKMAVAENKAPPKNPKPAKKTAKAKTGWKRLTGGGRGWHPVTRLAADPVPMTRQVRRQNARRATRMPIGARQDAWHRHLGLAVSKKMEARR